MVFRNDLSGKGDKSDDDESIEAEDRGELVRTPDISSFSLPPL